MKGYKVVEIINGKLYSFMPFPCRLTYEIGKWTKPKKSCGPLAVFSSLEWAVDFLHDLDGHTIYECEYKPSEDKCLWVNNIRTHKCVLPPDTQFASAVKLISEISDERN